MLDTASLYWSVVDRPHMAQAALCIRAGYLALRQIANFLELDHPTDPKPDDPIAITREEFDEAVAQLKSSGVPIVRDLEQGWRDFRGWRVNYDSVLIQLAAITEAPYAPWSSDRGIAR